MSTGNDNAIISLAERRERRAEKAKASPAPQGGQVPAGPAAFGELLRDLERDGHPRIATVMPADDTIADLRDMLEAAHDAGWKATHISPGDLDAGLVITLEVAVRVLDGGALTAIVPAAPPEGGAS